MSEVVSGELARRLDALLRPWDRGDAPGLVIGVALDGVPVYRRGLGLASIEHRGANTPATRMRIGSTSKHFAALCALLLAEEGRLDLDVPARRWLPELDGIGGEPSLRQMMQHTSGLRDPYDLPGLLLLGQWSTVACPGFALELGRRFSAYNYYPPGARMIYCNQGYHLLSLAVERAAGMPFGEFLRRRLLQPLGMADTALLSSDLQIAPALATLHVPQADGGFRRGIYPSEEVLGSGGIVSTIDDMLRWMAHLRAGHKLFGGPRVWRQLLQRPRYRSGAEGDYCLGLIRERYRGAEIVHHAGAMVGGTSQMLMLPDHALDVSLMFNRGDGPASGLALKVVDAVLGEWLAPEAPLPQAAQHPDLIGRWYEPRSHRVFGISAPATAEQGGGLSFSIHDQSAGPLRATADGSLRLSVPAHGPIELRPGKDGDKDWLEIADCGETARYRRLPAAGPAAAELAPRLVGRYLYEELDRELRLELGADGLYLDLLPPAGRFRFLLTPYSDEVLGGLLDASWALPVPAEAMPATLAVERRDGAVAGLWLSSWRSRNLWLKRRP